MKEVLFSRSTWCPYDSAAGVNVKDRGNGLPITVWTSEDDPKRASSACMTVELAENFRLQLDEAITKAKETGI